MIFRDGFHYKFEQTHVVASRSPRNFACAPIVSNLYPDFRYPDDWWFGLAPEIVEHDGEHYVALFQNHHERPLSDGGVFLARLKWAPIDLAAEKP